MRFIFLVSFVLTRTCFGQTAIRYFQKGNQLIELTSEVERFYTREIQPSTAYNFYGYILKEERVLSETEFFDPLAGKKKVRYTEISAGKARELLLINYIQDHQRSIEQQLSHNFPYYQQYYTRSYHYYATSSTCSNYPLQDSLGDILVQRNAIDIYYQREYDSLVVVHQQYNNLVTEFISRKEVPTYESTQQVLAQIPNLQARNGSYEAAILNYVIQKNPEIFYAHVTASDQAHSQYFMVPDAQGMKKVKQTKSSSPIRKELIKYRRKQNWIGAAVVTGAVVIDVAIIGGIVYLIKVISR